MGTGRPTSYSDEMLEKANLYLNDYEKDGDVIPTVEGLAERLGVTKKTLYNWAKVKENKSFLHSLDKLVQKQAKVLQNKGLKGEFNSTIAKLILSANHGMVERKDVTSDGKELPTPLLGYVSDNNSNEEDTGNE